MTLPRRDFLRHSAFAALAATTGLPGNGGLMARLGLTERPSRAIPPGIQKFRIGSLECVAISDGVRHYPPAFFFANAPEDELERRLAEHGIGPDGIPSSYNCLAIRSGGEWALVDTGIGPIDPELGMLLPRLREAGIAPEEVTTVILTHAHPDHIGGITDEAGNINFPRARFVMWKAEWDFWTSEDQLTELPEMMAGFARKNLPPVRERMDLLERETEVLPGIHAIPAAGHTPGHMVLGLDSDGEHMLVTGDAILHPINLSEPGWHAAVDMDPEAALRTRRTLLERATAERVRLQAFHFHPFPGIGAVERAGDGWRWRPWQM